MASYRKFYVVWEGRAPGIYDSWDEARAQVEGFPGARYRAYPDQISATEAFRSGGSDSMALFKAMAAKNVIQHVNYEAFPEIRLDAIAVDAACSRNPGPMEYQAVRVVDGQRIFHVGPIPAATNNIGEYLAIIHCAAMLAKSGDRTTPIYSDSRTAISWIRAGHSRSKLTPSPENSYARQLLAHADAWLANNVIPNPLLKWQTELWGEIPADFGRK